MSHHFLEAVKQAKWAFEHKDMTTTTRQNRIDWIRELDDWKVFSNIQIANFVGLKSDTVGAFTGKTDKTGGRLNPEALGDIMKVIHIDNLGQIDPHAIKRVLDQGVSTRMLARLTGLVQSTITRRNRAAQPSESS